MMAGFDTYDPRIDSMVMETKTLWDPEITDLTDEDRNWLRAAVHAQPDRAAKIRYERSHTGFTREITVTLADIERLYHERVGD